MLKEELYQLLHDAFLKKFLVGYVKVIHGHQWQIKRQPCGGMGICSTIDPRNLLAFHGMSMSIMKLMEQLTYNLIDSSISSSFPCGDLASTHFQLKFI